MHWTRELIGAGPGEIVRHGGLGGSTLGRCPDSQWICRIRERVPLVGRECKGIDYLQEPCSGRGMWEEPRT